MLSKTSRTRRHTRLKRHQVVLTHQGGAKPAVGRPWGNNRLTTWPGPAAWPGGSPSRAFAVIRAVARSSGSVGSGRRSFRTEIFRPRHRWPRCPRGRAAHAATRGRSEARWHGDGQEPGYRACGRDKPNVGLPPYSDRVPAGSWSFSTVPSATPTALAIRCTVRQCHGDPVCGCGPRLGWSLDASPRRAAHGLRVAQRGSRWYGSGQEASTRAVAPVCAVVGRLA
jgi:hypothetical protein